MKHHDKSSPDFFLPILWVWMLLFSLNAQSQVFGRIVNQADKAGIANASVFFDSATIGTTTDGKGQFTLPNVKPGKYNLVVTVLGFSPFKKELTIENSPIDLGTISLVPKPVALKEVRVVSNNAVWQRNFEWFRTSFLGTTGLANDCKIVNPKILDMVYKSRSDSLIVTSDDFLVIENRDLGYRVKYLVDEFTRSDSGRKVHYQGPVLFEEMSGTPAQRNRWLKNRREVYEGSAMHFLRSALADRLDENGFRVFQYSIYSNPNRPPDSLISAKLQRFKKRTKSKAYRDSLSYWTDKWKSPKILHALLNFPLTAAEVVRRTNQKGIFALSCENDGLYIIYDKNRHFPARGDMDFLTSRYNENSTLITINTLYVLFDNSGWVINPNEMSVTGAWTKNRVAGLLPLDYDPSDK